MMRHLYIACFVVLMLVGQVYAQKRGTITCDPDSPTSVPAWTEPGSAYIVEQLSCGQEVSISHLERGFFAIQIGDRIGYVAVKYVRLSEVQENSGKSDGQSRSVIELSQPKKQAEAMAADQRRSLPDPQGVVVVAPVLFDDSDTATPVIRTREWRRHEGGAYFDISHIYYGEANLMRNKGMMYGLSGDYTYRPNKFLLRAEARFSFGDVDYWSIRGGIADDLRDYNFETRFTFGHDLLSSGKASITPYSGIGYRYLLNNLSEAGPGGYDRKQSYLYSPIGMESMFKAGANWAIGIAGEYDLFWHGWNKSEFDDAGLSDVPLKLSQDSGWGARGSLRFIRNFENIRFSVEPFFRYWNIDESDPDVSAMGIFVGNTYREPTNSTMEWGTRVGFRF